MILARQGLIATLFLVLLSSTAAATTIFSVSGPNDGTLATSFAVGQGVGASFTTTSDYSNVVFSTTFIAFSGSTSLDLEVFLTDQIGAGTTPANEIASSTPSANLAVSGLFPPYTLTTVDILTVPFLPAGTYFLTMRGTAFSGPGNPFTLTSPDANRIVVTDAGVTVASNLFNGLFGSYLPESSAAQTNTNTWFTANGDLAGVPEPSSLLLSFAGLALVGFRVLRRK